MAEVFRTIINLNKQVHPIERDPECPIQNADEAMSAAGESGKGKAICQNLGLTLNGENDDWAYYICRLRSGHGLQTFDPCGGLARTRAED